MDWKHTAAVWLSHATAVAIVAGGVNFRHFTWCYITMFFVMMLMKVVECTKYWFWFYTALSFVIIASVVTMSLKGCRVFEDAYDENGPMSFIVGNFGMHMFPAVAVYALADRADVYCGKDNVVIQCNLALAVSLVWLHFEDPMQVYECSLPTMIGVTGFFIGTLCVLLLGVAIQSG